MTRAMLSCLVCLAVSTPVIADAYSPSLSELLGLSDVTLAFGPTQTSRLESFFEDNGGVKHNVTWDATGEGFSRVVLQQGDFEKDLSDYDAFNFNVEAMMQDITIKPYVQTGADYDFFESSEQTITAGARSLVSFDLTGIPNLDNTRQFGYQVFGPESGSLSEFQNPEDGKLSPE